MIAKVFLDVALLMIAENKHLKDPTIPSYKQLPLNSDSQKSSDYAFFLAKKSRIYSYT